MLKVHGTINSSLFIIKLCAYYKFQVLIDMHHHEHHPDSPEKKDVDFFHEITTTTAENTAASVSMPIMANGANKKQNGSTLNPEQDVTGSKHTVVVKKLLQYCTCN